MSFDPASCISRQAQPGRVREMVVGSVKRSDQLDYRARHRQTVVKVRSGPAARLDTGKEVLPLLPVRAQATSRCRKTNSAPDARRLSSGRPELGGAPPAELPAVERDPGWPSEVHHCLPFVTEDDIAIVRDSAVTEGDRNVDAICQL